MVQVTLQAANGQYVCAEGGGSQSLVANRNAVGDWEKFTLIERGNRVIALRAVNGCFVTAVGGGGGELHSRVKVIDIWESFKLIDRGDGKIALQCHNGQYVCAEGGGGQKLVANRNAIDLWETFTLKRLEVPATSGPVETLRTDLYYPLPGATFGGSGGQPFEDSIDVVARGPITKVVVRCADEIDSIRLFYGEDGAGNKYGGDGGKEQTWEVPKDEQIVRVEGRAGERIDQLRFFTDKGTSSPVFGDDDGGRRFVYPEGGNVGFLRTISGRAGRKIDQITLQFSAPYFIKDIIFDEQAIAAIAKETTPIRINTRTYENKSSAEQQDIYTFRYTASEKKTMTFQQSRSLKLGATVSVKKTTPPGGVESSLTLNAEGTWTRVATQAYESGKTEEDTVSIPLKIPPKTRVTIISTIRKAEITVPFTYIVAWYDEKTKAILKEERLPGTYKGVQSWDIRHSTNEEPLSV
ncbi:MAG: jacalin-like lectin [Nostoc sp. DcaGUA01]|nr:jacalin-like lectin [Nostoc sp. DcaGUA01]